MLKLNFQKFRNIEQEKHIKLFKFQWILVKFYVDQNIYIFHKTKIDTTQEVRIIERSLTSRYKGRVMTNTDIMWGAESSQEKLSQKPNP